MRIARYLRFDHSGAKVQDGGNPAGEAPELLLAIPVAARRLDDGVQGLLVWLGLDEHHLWSARPDGLATDK